ncbi:MAG: hypothetical protein M0P01_13155 [Treponema sp.]|nr:hypothetical protein [Treponema sp.]
MYAQKNETNTTGFNNGFSFGSIWRVDNSRNGGSAEFGFPVHSGKTFVRDYATLNGAGGKAEGTYFGEASIGNKVQIGNFIRCAGFAVIPYFFINAEFGLEGFIKKNTFNKALLADFNGGGGFEFRFTSQNSFFIEYGGGYFFPIGTDRTELPADSSAGYALLAIGTRLYL